MTLSFIIGECCEPKTKVIKLGTRIGNEFLVRSKRCLVCLRGCLREGEIYICKAQRMENTECMLNVYH